MNLYREQIMDHYRNPRNRGTLTKPDVVIEESNPVCGDKLKLMYNINDDRISDVKFDGEGCAISLAAASMLTEMIDGKMLTEVRNLKDEDMLQEIGIPLSPTRVKCGLLALSGLRKSFVDSNLVRHGTTR